MGMERLSSKCEILNRHGFVQGCHQVSNTEVLENDSPFYVSLYFFL